MLGELRSARRHLTEHLFHYRIRADFVCFALEVEQQTVAQGGERHAADVLDCDERLAPDQRVDLRREHQRLCRARAGAVPHVAVHEWRAVVGPGMGRQRQPDRVGLDRAGNRHRARDVVQLAKLRLTALVVFTFGAGVLFAPVEVSLDRALLAARVASDNKAKNILVLDMRGITPLYDFFVLATGQSRRQIHTLAEEIDAALRAQGEVRLGIEGSRVFMRRTSVQSAVQ